MHLAAFFYDTPNQHNHLPDGQLHHAAGIAIRRIEYGHALLHTFFEGDLVGADTESPHGNQLICLCQYFGGKLRFGANTQYRYVFDALAKLLLVETSLQPFYLIAFFLEDLGSLLVDILKE